MTTTRRAMFTINNPTFKDSQTLWNLGNNKELTTYLVYGAEHTNDDGSHPEQTPHFQGFIIFSKVVKKATVCSLLGGRAWVGFPKREDPSAKCANYCKKEGFYMEFGAIPGSKSHDDDELSAKQLKKDAVQWLENPENLYVRFKDVPVKLLMTPGFLNAYQARRKTLLGPDREVKVITIIGPSACGKSYASHNICPDHAKCFYGNSGAWFANADAPVLLIEEFGGQIPLQKMLTILDHYPFQLEEKGGFSPAMYSTVIITSNVTPDHWYGNFVKQGKMAEEAMRLGISLEEAERKWNESKKALYDRLGYMTSHRGTGYYREWAYAGLYSPTEELMAMRREIYAWVDSIINPQRHEAEAAHDFDEVPDTVELDAVQESFFRPPTHLPRTDDMDGIDAWAAAWYPDH